MRTQDEIVKRLRDHGDPFGFGLQVLLPHLDFDHAREFLKNGATRADWESPRQNGDGVEERYPLAESAALRDFRAYAAFAWGKAQDHRGLSAMRSVEKLTAWTWLLGRDDVLDRVQQTDYALYGCPVLRVLCEAFDFPIPDDEGARRMMRGEPCRPDCPNGCVE